MQTSRSQKGLALLMLVFIIALALTGYALKLYNPTTLKVEQAKRTSQALNEAKQALIAWAVSNSFNLGQMPYPDRAGGGGYDGKSDCLPPFIPFNYSYLIGQLPIYGQTAPCVNPQTGLGINTQDAQGNRLWYAVSRNLVHKYDTPASNPVINPSIIDAPTYSWLRVLDRNGVPISEHVAAVIIAPGNAVGNQSRSNTAAAGNFLDAFMGGSNSDYSNAGEDFFIVEGSPDINDKLVYITIDELMTALEKRVAQEVISTLNRYYDEVSAPIVGNRFYPYAADVSFNCIDGLLTGALPIGGGVPCSTPPLTGLPIWFGQNSWESFIYYAISPDCSNNGPNRGCASGVITVGSQSNVNAILITTGAALPQTELAPIFPQNGRPSNDVRDYLDSAENTDGDNSFDAKNKPKSNVYNDQMFVVTP